MEWMRFDLYSKLKTNQSLIFLNNQTRYSKISVVMIKKRKIKRRKPAPIPNNA